MQTSTKAALTRAGTFALLALISLLLSPVATASPRSAGDPSVAGGDEVIGTLPGRVADVTRYTLELSTCPVVIEKQLAGEPGVTITAARAGLILVARSSPPGTIDATVATPEVWTASWVSSGTTFTVTITQEQNETDDQAAQRLDRKVRAMQRLRPRDGDSTGPGGPTGVWNLNPRQGWREEFGLNLGACRAA